MPLLNVENARENVRRYAWAQAIVEGWKNEVDYLIRQDREFVDAMVSELTPWPEYGQNCPVCVNRLSSMGETGIYDWDPTDPDRLICRYCKTEYPNEDYPETGSVTAPGMNQTFAFYLTDAERAHPEDRSGEHAFKWVRTPVHTSWSGVIRAKKCRWCWEQMLPLAKLYALTGDVRYARWSAWIMDCMARRYPNWLFHSYDGTVADCPPAEAAVSMGRFPPAGRFPPETIISAFEGRHRVGDHAVLNNGFWGAGRVGCSGSDGWYILRVVMAYDLIRSARDADGSLVITPEMDRRIVDDLILAGCADTENWNDINNKCGPGRALSAAVGILFNKPESVRRAIQGFEALMDDAFHFDGFCTESPSYSSMHLNQLREIPELLNGYSDPEGYVPKSGSVLKDLDPFQHFDRYRLALESMVRMLDPNLEEPVIGDSREGSSVDPIYAEVLAARYGSRYAGLLEKSQGAPLSEKGTEYALWNRDPDLKADEDARLPHRTEWFPGWHVGVLRGGNPGGHTAFYLNGYAYGGHRHADTLGIIYVSNGKEMAADRGYIWDDPRNAWTGSTLAHNIVTVDGQNQARVNKPSALELFGYGAGIEIVQASASPYEQCDSYRRTCVLVQVPGDQTYAVDIFRVDGGSLHQYGFHSNGRLSGISGADPMPVDEHIEWLDNIRADRPRAPFTATWDNQGVRIDLTLLNPIHRLLLVDAPGWRSDLGEDLNAPPVQQVLAERGDDSHLTSRYAAVISPYVDRSPVLSSRLLLDDPDTGAMAVAVCREGCTDYILSAPEGGAHNIGPLSVTGQFAFASVDDGGALLRAYLLRGTELKCNGLALTPDRSEVSLEVARVSDRTYTLHNAVPDPETLPGAYLLCGDTGYEIEDATEVSITVRDYPATECGTVTLLKAAEYVKDD